MLDCEEVFGESNTAFMKVMPMVEYDKHQIFKASLVYELNANPILSKEMLAQVKNSIYFIDIDAYMSASALPTSMVVGLEFIVDTFLVSKNSN